MLAFIEQMALRPDTLDATALQTVIAAGVTRSGVREAAYVCALFSTIIRLADALQWDVPETWNSGPDQPLVKFGYRMPPGL
jgi:alkylhydroperoxidase family enzyme